ncbi:response regulator transcription factor [Rhodoferax sp.]|uniref:response regulator transcription factor n=1 Tax=Rhodoferax sp. TaxID=50421 RepID=UPI00374D0D32
MSLNGYWEAERSTGSFSAALQNRISVLVAHQDSVVSAGLAAILADCPDIAVSRQTPPLSGKIDIVLADYQTGNAWLDKSRSSAPNIPLEPPRVVILTSNRNECDVRSTLSAGAHGYLLQGCHHDELVHSVRSVARGARYFCAAVAQCLGESLTRVLLTQRETDVLQQLIQGLSNKAIANALGIAVGTVKAHVKAILEKLQVSSRTQAASLAVERGLISSTKAPPSAGGKGTASQLQRANAPVPQMHWPHPQ